MKTTVTLKPKGQSFEVEPDESVLGAALRHGINLPHSCRGGTCLSCCAQVLSGDVTYPQGRPAALAADEAARGLALLCQARPLTDLVVDAREIEVSEGIRIRRLPCRVERKERLADDVMALYLKLPVVEPFAFVAGQYVDILLKDGRRRSFSIASSPGAGSPLEVHVRHVPGGEFSGKVFTALEERSLLRIEGPLGGFFLREESLRAALMIGGGTGFAPLKSMLSDVIERGLSRRIHLYWGGRTSRDLYQRDFVERLAAQRPDFHFTPVISEPERDPQWRGRSGWVHRAVLEDYVELSDYDVYASGPPAMINAIRQDFLQQGLPAGQLYYDSFEYATDTLEAIRRGQ